MGETESKRLDDPEFERLVEMFDEGGLSRGEAEVYVSRSVEGLGRKETAERVDRSANTVDVMYQRANAKLESIDSARELADRAV